MTDTTTRNDEQYELAQKMTAEYERVLNVCARIYDRNSQSGEPWDDEMIDRIIDEHIGDPLEIYANLGSVPLNVVYGYESGRMTDYIDEIVVLLGTGGPARGINFRNGNAYCWHQDWFTPRVEDIHPLNDSFILAMRWGLEDQ